MKTPLLMILATGIIALTSVAQASPMSCENNKEQQSAAQVLASNLSYFSESGSIPAIEIVDISDKSECNTNWAAQVLELARYPEMINPTCGVKLVFNYKASLINFARASIMLTPDSQSTISQMETGGFNSRDPHDPYGNQQMVKRSVPFCATLKK